MCEGGNVVGVLSQFENVSIELVLITSQIIVTSAIICSNTFEISTVISYLISNSLVKNLVPLLAAMKITKEEFFLFSISGDSGEVSFIPNARDNLYTIIVFCRNTSNYTLRVGGGGVI